MERCTGFQRHDLRRTCTLCRPGNKVCECVLLGTRMMAWSVERPNLWSVKSSVKVMTDISSGTKGH